MVIDADVLGRQRTGDETYMTALLRELAGTPDLRLAAVTRRPDLVPDRIEPLELQAHSQIAGNVIAISFALIARRKTTEASTLSFNDRRSRDHKRMPAK